MSYRWNAHETVASGAVSDSEAPAQLQTAMMPLPCPSPPEAGRGPRGRALRYPAYLCDPADFGYPFLFRARVRARCTGPHRGAPRPKPRHPLADEH